MKLREIFGAIVPNRIKVIENLETGKISLQVQWQMKENFITLTDTDLKKKFWKKVLNFVLKNRNPESENVVNDSLEKVYKFKN